MKVHNYGNDYAYQLKQKKTENKPIVEPETPTENVEHQLPEGGEAAVAAANNEANGGAETPKAPEKGKRKKKEKTVYGLQEQG